MQYIIKYLFTKNIYNLFCTFVRREVPGANAPLLLAPAEGLGPSGPAVGLWPPALELKLYIDLKQKRLIYLEDL